MAAVRLPALLVLVTGCGRLGFALEQADTDALVSDAAPPWQLVESWSLASSSDDPSLSDDLLVLAFNTSSSELQIATRPTVSSPWSAPAPIVELAATGARESTPELSADGLAIVFASDRTGDFDIWSATRASRSATWSAPIRVEALSTSGTDHPGQMTSDGLVTVKDIGGGSGELYLAARASAAVPWDPPVLLTEVNSAGDDESPALSADGLELYFDSDRSGTYALYVARRASRAEPFGAPVPIAELAGTGNAYDPWLSADGHHLVYAQGGEIIHVAR